MDSTGLNSNLPADDASHTSDVVVGIATYNNAATIDAIARSASDGLGRHGLGGCIVLADGGSTDGTLERAQLAIDARVPAIRVPYLRTHDDPLRPPYHGMSGRPSAIRAILNAARERDAKSCVF